MSNVDAQLSTDQAHASGTLLSPVYPVRGLHVEQQIPEDAMAEEAQVQADTDESAKLTDVTGYNETLKQIIDRVRQAGKTTITDFASWINSNYHLLLEHHVDPNGTLPQGIPLNVPQEIVSEPPKAE